MENKIEKETQDKEEKLSALLASLRLDPTPEADFESRMLADFHERLKQEERPETLRARLQRFFSAVWQRKAVYGSAFAGVCVLIVAYGMWFQNSLNSGAPVSGVELSARSQTSAKPTTVVNLLQIKSDTKSKKALDNLLHDRDGQGSAASSEEEAADAPAVNVDAVKVKSNATLRK